MTDYQGTTGPQISWEETYRVTPPAELPWNAGMADGDLLDLLDALQPAPGKAYDLGCGPGNDTAYLAKEGWKVTAVDISPTAVKLAKEAAATSGVEGKVQFVTGDVLALEGRGDADLVQDRGCFHTLPSDSWGSYVKMMSRLLKKGGILALKVFSFKEPGDFGPRRFTVEELDNVFGEGFELTSVKETVFQGPRKPFALFAVFRKK